MNIVTGCSGIDAIAFAAQLLDIEIIGQIEIDEFCNKILELRYPGVKRLKNVFDVRGDEFGAVDIFAAGIPCQPFSHAGKREGTEDNRYLWPEAIRIIQVMQPGWVIIENVSGIGSMEQSDSETVMETETEICQDSEMVLETIRKDLEEAKYNSVAIIIPACGVGALHRRDRYFIVANRNSIGWMGGESSEQSTGGGKQTQPRSSKCNPIMGNSMREQNRRDNEGRLFTESTRTSESGVETMADTTGEGLQEWKQSRRWQDEEEAGAGMESKPERCSKDVAYTQCQRQQGQGQPIQSCNPTQDRDRQASGIEHVCVGEIGATKSGMGGNADGIPGGLYGPGRQEDGSGISGTFEAIFTAVLDQILWPAGYGAEQHPWEPPRVATGVKNRTNRLKALGNSIVPWQIFGILLGIKIIHEIGCEVEKD